MCHSSPIAAEEERSKYAKLFGEVPPDDAQVEEYLDNLNVTPLDSAPRLPEIDPVGNALKQRAARQRKKAPGADAWRLAHFARLPMGWFAALAKTWNVVLAGARIPPIWAMIRMVSIPKHDGTGAKRGLGVAPYAWRVGMSELMRHHSVWMDEWLDGCIASGPKRSGDDMVDRLLDQMEAAAEEGTPLSGCKIDLSKYFDRCDWRRSLRILRRHGMSENLLRVIGSFYEQVHIAIEANGATAKEFIRPRRGLLQGCPASVIMAIAEQNLWALHMKASAPEVEVAAYVDDRTMWARGENAATKLESAIQVARKFDDDAGWCWNEGKGQMWTSSAEQKSDLDAIQPSVGAVSNEITLLGVTINVRQRASGATGAHGHQVLRHKSAEKAMRQCRRIRLACPVGSLRARTRRAKLVQQLVLPKICWGGQWQRPKQSAITKWANEVERTINGPRLFRSPAVAKIATGARYSPEFGIDWAALRHELWRARRENQGIQVGSRGSRFDEVATKWKWERTGRYKFETAMGELNLEADGDATIKVVAEDAWATSQWQYDNRAKDEQSQKLLTSTVPYLQVHREWLESGTSEMKRTAVGAAMDCRSAEWAAKAGGKELETFECACGELFPTRRHWMWDCQAIPGVPLPPQGSAERPRCELEAALGVRLVPRAPKAKKRTAQCPVGIVTAIRQAAASAPDRPVMVATDGGVQNSKHKTHRIGAWAAAIEGTAGITAHADVVQGIDQTSFAAELAGAIAVLRAAVRARAAVHLVIDNRGVQRGVAQRLAGCVPQPRFCFATWAEVDRLATELRKLRVDSECTWVPSHGKKMEEWMPPPGLSGVRVRRLNDRADVAASALAERRWTCERQAESQAEAAAKAWVTRTLSRLQRAERQYVDQWLPGRSNFAA